MPGDEPPSVFRPGGISYLHIPCREPNRAAAFYERVFGWTRRRDGGEPAFADASGHVIGHFVAGEPAPEGTGLLVFVYVDDLAATLAAVGRNGGRVGHEPRPEGTLQVATICDPEGNMIGVWTETAR